jgi:transcriptional regulator with XRE-family HTH domain
MPAPAPREQTAPINLEEERVNRGLSLNQAAGEIRVARNTLAAAEAGGRIRPASAKAIADFYGYRVTDIWPVEEQPA